MKKLIIVAILLIAVTSFGRINDKRKKSDKIKVEELYPTVKKMSFSKKGEKQFYNDYKECEKVWAKMSAGTTIAQLTARERYLLENVEETKTKYWDVLGEEDGWYDMGGPKKIKASSFLKAQGKNSYIPKKAMDLNYKTAWVEGKKDYGIGEYLEYSFKPNSPRVTEVIVVNGYVKSEKAYKNNSRVKKLKLYIDGKPYAHLNLKDIIGEQKFKIKTVGYPFSKWKKVKNNPDIKLKFEILEVYKGDKYKDTAITEIYFNGLDVY